MLQYDNMICVLQQIFIHDCYLGLFPWKTFWCGMYKLMTKLIYSAIQCTIWITNNKHIFFMSVFLLQTHCRTLYVWRWVGKMAQETDGLWRSFRAHLIVPQGTFQLSLNNSTGKKNKIKHIPHISGLFTKSFHVHTLSVCVLCSSSVGSVPLSQVHKL